MNTPPMASQRQVITRAVTTEDRNKLANLIHFEMNVHRHLDWRTPLEWIGYPPYLAAEENGELVAALACPPDPPQAAWIRLFAASYQMHLDRAWELLWPVARQELAATGDARWVAAIPFSVWFADLLAKNGFKEVNRVVMMDWDGAQVPHLADTAIGIRPMNFDDIVAVHAVDIRAFDPLWQNSRPSLELAYHQATIASVVEAKGSIVAYQISTGTPIGGHLARLAVIPEYQGQGVGHALLTDLLSQFKRRGARKITVNTQINNLNSLALYQKAGFRRTGEEYQVYQYDLDS